MTEEAAAPQPEAEPIVAPEQQPAAQPEANVQDQPPPEGEQPADQQPVENKGKERLTQRFSELTGRARAAEERAEAAERRAAAIEARQPQYQQQEGPPDPSQYEMGEYDPRFVQDAISHGIRATLAEERRQQSAAAAQSQRAMTAQTVSEKLLQSGLEGAVNLVMDTSARVTPEMVDALARSEDAPRLADHLGRNTAEASRIANLPPHLQGYELAKLESRLASLPRTTNAPPPPNPVGGRATATVDPKNMTMEQYKAARESGAI